LRDQAEKRPRRARVSPQVSLVGSLASRSGANP